MKNMLFAVVMFTVFFAVSAYAVNTTRYWDGCKPSCGWTANASGSPNGTCKSCNVSGGVISNDGERNACESGGTAYTCMKQAPWSVSDNLSYGFAASHTNGDCGKCFELTFTNTSISGKKMVIMVSNIGGDVANGQFDLMIPGGGVGQFNALSNQIQQNGGNNSDLGIQYGGFRGKCGANKTCVRDMCDKAFGSAALADLKAGCYWYVDWFDNADNPQANSVSVTCPQALIDKYKGNFSSTTPTPTPTTYTLTVNRNPTAGGTTNPASSQANITAGTQVPISATAASGYTFNNWTVSGSGTLANANNASTTVTVNGNVTVTANFKLPDGTVPTPPAGGGGDTIKVEAENYTSKIGDKMQTNTANGITNIGYIENGYSATYNNVSAAAAGDYVMQFRVAAGTDIASYSFTVSVNGQNAGTVSGNNTGNWDTYVTVTLNSKVKLNAGNNTIALNFQSAVNVDYFLLIGDAPPAPQKYALTVGKNPANGGSVKVNNADYTAPVTVTGGTATPIAATAAEGYTFKNWTAGNGAAITAANNAATTVTVSANATVTANFEQIPIGVRYNAVNRRTQVTLRPASRGFTAALPVGHGFTYYRLIDLQGKEVRSGSIDGSTTSLSVGNLKHSVVFLRLEGKGRTPLSMMVVTY